METRRETASRKRSATGKCRNDRRSRFRDEGSLEHRGTDPGVVCSQGSHWSERSADTAAATNAAAQLWSDFGGDVSHLPQRVFPISWTYSARIVAVGMQSADYRVSADRARVG